MKKIYIKVDWVCDQCGFRKTTVFHRDPEEFGDTFGDPYELPENWFSSPENWFSSPTEHYCFEKCLCKAHPETKSLVWMASVFGG